MSWIMDQLRDWVYYAKTPGTNNRGFFIGTGIAFIVLLIIVLLLFVGACFGVVAGGMRVVGFISPVIYLALFFGFLFMTQER